MEWVMPAILISTALAWIIHILRTERIDTYLAFMLWITFVIGCVIPILVVLDAP